MIQSNISEYSLVKMIYTKDCQVRCIEGYCLTSKNLTKENRVNFALISVKVIWK